MSKNVTALALYKKIIVMQSSVNLDLLNLANNLANTFSIYRVI